MCTRQTGTRRNEFASNAKIYRYDIDAQQLKIHIHEGEVNKIADINILIERMPNKKITGNIKEWVSYAQQKKNDFLKRNTKLQKSPKTVANSTIQAF